MAIIKGYLMDGATKPIQDCTIVLQAKKTSNSVLTKTEAYEVANDGYYEMTVLPCTYEVVLLINGYPPKNVGTIQVFADSEEGSLNDFLLNPSESELTPAIIAQVIEERKKAQDAANSAIGIETSAKASADNAKVSEEAASKAAQQANDDVTVIESLTLTATNAAELATQSKVDAETFASNAEGFASNAEQSVNSANHSANLAQQYANSAEISAQDALRSETNADNSAIVAKESAEKAELAVINKVDKTTTINGKALSSNIELNTNDVGALSVSDLSAEIDNNSITTPANLLAVKTVADIAISAKSKAEAVGRCLAVKKFTTSQKYTPTNGTTWIRVRVVGGGGYGQFSSAGSYCESVYTFGSWITFPLDIIVGATGTVNSQFGGMSKFGSHMYAQGGAPVNASAQGGIGGGNVWMAVGTYGCSVNSGAGGAVVMFGSNPLSVGLLTNTQADISGWYGVMGYGAPNVSPATINPGSGVVIIEEYC